MLQFLTDIIDQLDLALDQLAINDRNFDRFALMLVDNVMELTLYSFVQDKARENDMWGRMGSPRHDLKVIDKGMGQAFDGKAKAARALDLIDGMRIPRQAGPRFRGMSVQHSARCRSTIPPHAGPVSDAG